MDKLKQIDCFNRNFKVCKILGIWRKDSGKNYKYYAFFILIIFVILYDLLFTVNFGFIPRKLEIFIDDIMLYCNIIQVVPKVLVFCFSHDKIVEILDMLESDIFQPNTEDGIKIIDEAKRVNIKFWKIVAIVSLLSQGTHTLTPLFINFIIELELDLPVFSCDFLPENVKHMFFFPMYFYQFLGMHVQLWYNVSIDCLFLGLMIFIVAQLDILSINLKNVTNSDKEGLEKDREAIRKLNDCIIHYDKVANFCNLVQDVFSVTLFIQFGTASVVICVCFFRFTMPASNAYYIYLLTYITVMMVQRAVPCWFGTRIIDKSAHLAFSVYDCDWTPRSRYFKSSLRLFVERANRPLNITGGKMVLLSLNTFTSIMNTAYSFYTLLRHMQSREN